MTISYTKSKQKIAILWLISGAFLFLILTLQTFTGKHGDGADDVWKWFLGAILPTLSLMIGVFVADFGKESKDRQVSRFLFRLAFYLSLFYLLMVSALLLGQPVTEKTLKDLIDAFSLPLQGLQGLVGLILGVFFVKS